MNCIHILFSMDTFYRFFSCTFVIHWRSYLMFFRTPLVFRSSGDFTFVSIPTFKHKYRRPGLTLSTYNPLDLHHGYTSTHAEVHEVGSQDKFFLFENDSMTLLKECLMMTGTTSLMHIGNRIYEAASAHGCRTTKQF